VNKSARVRRRLPRDARPASAFDDQRTLRRRDVFHRPRFVLQGHGMRGRRGGDGVLVDDLMAIAIEQHAERFPAALTHQKK
jgi:hypothetical protein